MKKYLFPIIALGSLALLSFLPGEKEIKNQEIITSAEDYNSILISLDKLGYIDSISLPLKKEITFWLGQIETLGSGFLYHEKLGRSYAQLFEITGDISNIHNSIQHYNKAANQSSGKYLTNILLAQSSNAIKLHEFAIAKDLCQQALSIGGNDSGASMMLFDALMELGEYKDAGEIMNKYEGSNSFDYLVRYGKYLDYKGDLEGAIDITELALSTLSSLDQSKMKWVKTHLADMYGHNGEIQKSYESYMNVLQEDPLNLYALKGIAWIAYSNDKDTDAAQRILSTLASATQLPDYFLQLGELAELNGDTNEKQHYIDEFECEVKEQQLESLYRTHLTQLRINHNNSKEALQLSKLELSRRKTPETFLLYAKALGANGNYKKSLNILDKHVIGQSFEPGNIYESGKLLIDLGEKRKGLKLLRMVEDAEFELGPAIYQDIQDRLKNGIKA